MSTKLAVPVQGTSNQSLTTTCLQGIIFVVDAAESASLPQAKAALHSAAGHDDNQVSWKRACDAGAPEPLLQHPA